MKTILPLSFVLLGAALVTACHSNRPTADNSAVQSERQYAMQSEARAQDLLKSGRASNIEEARATAAAEANQQWYAAAKAKERRAEQEKFEKDFKKSQASTP